MDLDTEANLLIKFSSRRFPYNYLVTTSSQLLTCPLKGLSFFVKLQKIFFLYKQRLKKFIPKSSGQVNSQDVTGGVCKAQ